MKNAYKSEPCRKVMSHILTGLPRQAGDGHSHVAAINGTSIPPRSVKPCRIRPADNVWVLQREVIKQDLVTKGKKDLMRSRLEKGGVMYSVRTG